MVSIGRESNLLLIASPILKICQLTTHIIVLKFKISLILRQIDLIVVCAQALLPAKKVSGRSSVVSIGESESALEEVTVSASINNVNIFLVVNDEKRSTSVMLRLDSSRLEKSKNKLSVGLEAVRVLTMDTGLYYNCIKVLVTIEKERVPLILLWSG